MNPRLKASLLWGMIGAFSFLVLVQGYELLWAVRLPFGVKFAVASIVGLAVVGSAYLLDPILFGENGTA